MLARAKRCFLSNVQIHLFSMIKVILGSALLSLCARIQIPLTSVPMTLQTLGIFTLALFLGGRQACLATLFYLMQATLGLPVVTVGSCPLWFLGTTGGYLLAMPLAAYVIGVLAKKNPTSLVWTAFAIFCGQCIIFVSGYCFLLRFFGFEKALLVGILPFLPAAGLKLIIATFMKKGYLACLHTFSNRLQSKS